MSKQAKGDTTREYNTIHPVVLSIIRHNRAIERDRFISTQRCPTASQKRNSIDYDVEGGIWIDHDKLHVCSEIMWANGAADSKRKQSAGKTLVSNTPKSLMRILLVFPRPESNIANFEPESLRSRFKATSGVFFAAEQCICNYPQQ